MKMLPLFIILLSSLLSWAGNPEAEALAAPPKISTSRFAFIHRKEATEQSKRKFLAVTAAQWGLMVTDYELSQRHFARGGHETNPIFGSARPSRARMYAVGVPINAALTFLAWRRFKHGNPRWAVYPMVSMQMHGAGIAMTIAW